MAISDKAYVAYTDTDEGADSWIYKCNLDHYLLKIQGKYWSAIILVISWHI